MKKKRFGLFVCFLLLPTIFIPSFHSMSGQIDHPRLNTNMTHEAQRISPVDRIIGCETTEYDPISIDYPLMNEEFTTIQFTETYPKPDIITTPDTFSWLEHNGRDWTTPVQDQTRECGSCWAFAAIGALESIINIREGCAELDPDLSEQYILSCLPASGSCNGGNSYLAYRYMRETTPMGNDHNGAIPEACFPYQANDEIPCSVKCSNWENYLVPISDYGYWDARSSSHDRERIKSQVFEDGPVVTHITVTDNFRNWGKIFHDPEDYYPYVGNVGSTNHCVVIVGWNDDPSIGNGGYWICKNSWETTWGYKGFFNIEYGSLNIDNSRIVWVDYNPESVDWSPVSNPGGPYAGDVNQEITVDGSKSFDAEGEIISYYWDFGDGETGTGMIQTHTYTTRGIHTITLTVTDEQGNTGTSETAALMDLWIPGDSWTYDIENVQLIWEEDIIPQSTNFKIKFSLSGSIEDCTFSVADDTEDFYTLEFTGRINGEIEIVLSTLVISGKLSRFSTLKGTLLVHQRDLGIQHIDAQIRGITSLSNELLPIGIPVPFTIEINANFHTIYPFINFPLQPGNSWGVPSTSITIDGQIKSIALRLINLINNIAGLIDQEFLPPEFSNLLPVIDIGDMLETFADGNIIEIPGGPDVFACTEHEEITVQAGTFMAYKITVVSSPWALKADLYFAPDIANILKVSINMEDILIIEGELKSSTYGR